MITNPTPQDIDDARALRLATHLHSTPDSLKDAIRRLASRGLFVPVLGPLWVEVEPLITQHGDIGGDIQVGESWGRRWRHTFLPGRLISVAAYPVRQDLIGEDPADRHPITLELQTELMICDDTDDPGGTERWSEVEYSDLPERYTGVYTDVEIASAAAKILVATTDISFITWDGRPDF